MLKPGATATSPASLSSTFGIRPPAPVGLSGVDCMAPQPARPSRSTPSQTPVRRLCVLVMTGSLLRPSLSRDRPKEGRERAGRPERPRAWAACPAPCAVGVTLPRQRFGEFRTATVGCAHRGERRGSCAFRPFMDSRRPPCATVFLILTVLEPSTASARADQPIAALAPVETVLEGRDELIGVAVTADGTLYVSDRGAGIVYRLPTSGALGRAASGLDRPAGLALD